MSVAGSVLAPSGAPALAVAEIGWTVIAGGALIFVGTMALLAWAIVRRGEGRVDGRRWVLLGGLAFPMTVLTALFLYSHFRIGSAEGRTSDPVVVTIVGRDWWWELRYRDPASGQEVVAANEIHLPAGREVVLGLNSGDVIHSFWAPTLAGKVDMIPGRVQQLRLLVAEPGRHRGQCAEFCGEQHANMALEVVIDSPDTFSAWLAAQAAPARPPTDPKAERGLRHFRAEGCAGCHAVRGLADRGAGGPDLTHVGSRRWIGAGTLVADEAGFARWIGGVQHLKPGARMPQYDRLDASVRADLAAFLVQLK